MWSFHSVGYWSMLFRPLHESLPPSGWHDEVSRTLWMVKGNIEFSRSCAHDKLMYVLT